MRSVQLAVALLGVSVMSLPSFDENFDQLPQIYSLHVRSDIRYRYAHTLVTSKVGNPANIPQEVTFTVVLPDTAYISGFLIEDGGQVYKAYVREKEAARRAYKKAVDKGKIAGYVGMSARDSNHFTVSVNVEPRKKVTFNLTYEELLIRTLGAYKHVINLDPGQIVRDFSVEVRIEESSDITTLAVPALKTTNEIDDNPSEGACCNPLAFIEHVSNRSVVVKWSPTPEEQKELAADGVRGQLVVKYDVDRLSHPYQVLVDEGYFAHYFAPADLQPLRKQVTFVLDVSGSMDGRKLHQLKEAMDAVLSDLRPTDFFSLVIFSSRTKVWCLESYRTWFAKLKKNSDCRSAVVPATRQNLLNAKLAINKLEAVGATNIHKAMKTALQISRLSKRNWKTTVEPGIEHKSRHPEPIVILLTDGEPTEGKTEPDRIVAATTRWNRKCKAAIFTLALGDEADFLFLKKLSHNNFGFARKIYESSDTALQLRDFYRQVASPLLANVTFKYQPDQVDIVTLTKNRFFSFYSGSELVVAGRLQRTALAKYLQYEVQARSSGGMTQFESLEDPVKIEFEPLDDRSGTLERLWAYLSIQQLLDRAESKSDKKSAMKKQALYLALKYSFVTRVTSLVVVKPEGTSVLMDTQKTVQVRPQPAVTDPVKRYFHSSLNPAQTGGPPHAFRGESFISFHTDSSFQELLWDDDEESLPVPGTPEVSANSWLPDSSVRSPDEGIAPMPLQPGAMVNENSRRVDFTDIDWLAAFIEGPQIRLPFGNTSVQVLEAYAPSIQQMELGQPCVTPEGERGYCRHLRTCTLSSFTQNFTLFLQYFCTLHDRFAGACCPLYLIDPRVS